MAKVLFIIPPISLSIDRDIGARHTSPHVGLAYVASYLRENGFEVEVVDAPIEGFSFDDMEKIVRKSKPDFVGITANTMQIEDANKTAGIIKGIGKDIPIIVGGYHTTAMPKETLEEFENFDYSVYGEGEITMLELIRTLEKTKDVSGVKGISFRSKEGVKTTEPRPYITNLDDMPFPAFDLFPIGKYNACASLDKKIIEVPLQTSRGCPFQCIFCARPLGNVVRYRSPENVIEEIKRDVEELNASQILFTDETFTLKKERTLDICDRIKKEKLDEKIKWYCETRVDTIDKLMLERMKDAGCIYIAYGIDSGNEEVLKKIKKGTNLEQARNAVKWAKDAGIRVFGSCILGHPYDTKETINDTINLMFETDPDFAAFSILSPFPGTEIMKMAEKGEGNLRILSHNWKKYGKQIGNALSLENVPRRELEIMQMKSYVKFYLRPGKITNMFRVVNIKGIPVYALHQIRNLVSY